MKLMALISLVVAALLSCAAGAAPAADACAGFKWDVGREHALFEGGATRLAAGKDVAGAPSLGTERLYEFDLAPQSAVAFALAPGKKLLTDGAYAGVAKFKVDKAATYRVSLDVPLWIDVVDAGKLLAPVDFGGQQGCLPHKVVAYELRSSQPLTLQMSAAAKKTVRVTITVVPAPPAAVAPAT